MTNMTMPDAYGVLTENDTLTLQRLLPGPIERLWAYLTESDLRRQWLAAGDMDLTLGSSVELVWRNDELTDPPGQRPEGASAENRMEVSITELDPPRRLAITWGNTGGVSFTLEPDGSDVMLTVVHSRLLDRSTMLNVGAGWHMHLDILLARMTGGTPAPFWDGWAQLKSEYDARLPV
jgi:uncharacterized protein YndB with AHSA1/START domain